MPCATQSLSCVSLPLYFVLPRHLAERVRARCPLGSRQSNGAILRVDGRNDKLVEVLWEAAPLGRIRSTGNARRTRYIKNVKGMRKIATWFIFSLRLFEKKKKRGQKKNTSMFYESINHIDS